MKASLRRWCEENSEPRVYPEPKKVKRGKTATLRKLMPRIRKMAKPRKNIGKNWTKDFTKIKPSALRYKITERIQALSELPERLKYKDPRYDPAQNWYYILQISDKTKNYVPSKRIIEMAMPMHPTKKYKKKRERYVKRAALTAKATPRINKLAEPKKKGKKWRKTRPRYVKPGALKAKASARLVKLAKHRVIVNKHTRKYPFRINKKTLQYKPTPADAKRAVPKSVTPKFVPDSEIHKAWMAERKIREDAIKKEKQEKLAKRNKKKK